MPENIRTCVENIARALSETPEDKREMVARLAETYAAGIAAGVELSSAAE